MNSLVYVFITYVPLIRSDRKGISMKSLSVIVSLGGPLVGLGRFPDLDFDFVDLKSLIEITDEPLTILGLALKRSSNLVGTTNDARASAEDEAVWTRASALGPSALSVATLALF